MAGRFACDGEIEPVGVSHRIRVDPQEQVIVVLIGLHHQIQVPTFKVRIEAERAVLAVFLIHSLELALFALCLLRLDDLDVVLLQNLFVKEDSPEPDLVVAVSGVLPVNFVAGRRAIAQVDDFVTALSVQLGNQDIRVIIELQRYRRIHVMPRYIRSPPRHNVKIKSFQHEKKVIQSISSLL